MEQKWLVTYTTELAKKKKRHKARRPALAQHVCAERTHTAGLVWLRRVRVHG
jgi:hypothetical protein